MDKILVPIDFSASSSWGFYYAYEMAKMINAELYVLHLYWPPYVESTYPMDMIQRIINEAEEEALEHMKAASQPPINDKNEVKMHFIVEPGSENSIPKIAKEKEIDLIIMGTHGADNAVEKVWGSNTSQVIQNSHCPVIAIPRGAEFHNVKNIAYATDFDENDTEPIFQLSLVAAAIGASVHCIHINPIDHKLEEKKKEAFQEDFKENFGELPVTFNVWSAKSVEDGLETFCRINKIDILAMMTHNKTFWDKVFGNYSMTKSMVLRTQLPLLAFHE